MQLDDLDTCIPRTSHLEALIGETDRLVRLLSGLPLPQLPPSAGDSLSGRETGRVAPTGSTGAGAVAGIVESLLAEAAVASLRLDGSPIRDVPDVRADLRGSAWMGRESVEERAANWLDVFVRGQVPDHQLLAVEYLGVRSGLAADDLAGALVENMDPALRELHRRLTRGLLHPDHAGQLRERPLSIQDIRGGRILYTPADPERISERLARLSSWLGSAGREEHGLVVSGVMHHELLSVHPFEAAGGRLARTAARLILRLKGLDPAGVAAAELVLLRDPISYADQVAATARRRDLGIWLEHWGEAVTGGLRLAAQRLGLLEEAVPGRAGMFVDTWRKPVFSLKDYRKELGLDVEEAREDLHRLLDAGKVQRVLGSRGLRFNLTEWSPD